MRLRAREATASGALTWPESTAKAGAVDATIKSWFRASIVACRAGAEDAEAVSSGAVWSPAE